MIYKEMIMVGIILLRVSNEVDYEYPPEFIKRREKYGKKNYCSDGSLFNDFEYV